MESKSIEYWTVENSGWSNGTSWFKTGGTDANPLRFNSHKEAVEYAKDFKAEWDDPTVLWRVVYNHFERFDNKEIKTRIFNEI